MPKIRVLPQEDDLTTRQPYIVKHTFVHIDSEGSGNDEISVLSAPPGLTVPSAEFGITDGNEKSALVFDCANNKINIILMPPWGT